MHKKLLVRLSLMISCSSFQEFKKKIKKKTHKLKRSFFFSLTFTKNNTSASLKSNQEQISGRDIYLKLSSLVCNPSIYRNKQDHDSNASQY